MSIEETITKLANEAVEKALATQRVGRMWLSPREASEYTGISIKQLEAWRARGVGPAFARVGRSVKYDLRALESFMSGRVV